MPKISPFLWFNDNAEEAMNFYTSVFKGGKVTSLRRQGDTVMGVALKLHMDPGQDERVDREIAAMEQIRHPNLANHPFDDTEEPPNALS